MHHQSVVYAAEAAKCSPFVPPAPLAGAVRFWTMMFTEVDSGHVVVHDRAYPDVVYRIVTLPRTRHGGPDKLAGKLRVQAVADAVRTRLLRLAVNQTPQDSEDAHLLRCLGGPNHDMAATKMRLQGAADRLRTQQGVADEFRRGLLRARPHLARIAHTLRRHGVPEEIAALPFIESMYNARAHSAAGARGIWQLMPATGRELGLAIGSAKDERLDTMRATQAAAKLLRRNYRLLGSWPLAITAYNHGAFGVRRAMVATGSTDLLFLIDHYQTDTWGFSSKNYYAEFLAALALVRPDWAPRSRFAHAAGP